MTTESQIVLAVKELSGGVLYAVKNCFMINKAFLSHASRVGVG